MIPNQVIENILVGAAGDGTGGLISGILLAAGARIARKYRPKPQRKALEDAFREALKVAFDSIPETGSLTRHYLDCLTKFLDRDLVQEELSLLLNPEDVFDVSALRNEFTAITRGYRPEQIPDLDFDAFIATLTHAFYAAVKNQPDLQEVIKIDRLDALVAQLDQLLTLSGDIKVNIQRHIQKTERTNELLEEIKQTITASNENVNHLLDIYLQQHTGEVTQDDLRPHIAEYIAWVAGRCGTLELRGVKRQDIQVAQLDLDSIYVPLAAETYIRKRGRDGYIAVEQVPLTIQMNDILSLNSRLVITGGPGSGKTTVLLHIAWTLALALAHDDPRLAQEKLGLSHGAQPLPLPIMIPLSAYAAHLRQLKQQPNMPSANAYRLDNFVTHYLIKNEAAFDLPPDFFAQLLKAETPLILLLDGLDEVPQESERILVRERVEQLVTRHKNLRVVVTCRTAAHSGKTALGKGFQPVRVQPIDDQQVTTLIEQAYAHFYRNDLVKRNNKTKELVDGVRRLEEERQKRLGKEAPRFIDSPLLVRMLIIVHLSEQRRLPEQRAELYMKAVDALLMPDYALDSEVAEQIGSFVGGRLEAHRELVQFLAFYMHQRGEKQGREINEDTLRAILGQNSAFTPVIDNFIALTRLRGTVLEERLGMYRFIHLTFQEFLTARYMAEEMWPADEILTYLEDGQLLDSWWREPILLLSGYLQSSRPFRAQPFLERLANVDADADSRSLAADTQLAGAELAAMALLEWTGDYLELRQLLCSRIEYLLLKVPDVRLRATPLRRAEAGDALGRLGDARKGVCSRLPLLIPITEELTFEMGKERKRVTVPAPYAIAKYPVTNAQFRHFVEDGGYTAKWKKCWAKDGLQGWRYKESNGWTKPRYWDNPRFNLDNQPVVGINWYEAVTYANWLTEITGDNYRLPTEAEWERAARHTDGRTYPWGNSWQDGFANSEEAGIGRPTAVGIFPDGASECGLLDMSGNVWEWCQTRWRDEKGKNYAPIWQDDGREKLADNNSVWRVLKGDAYYIDKNRVSAAARYGYIPNHGWSYNRGVRVVVSPFISGR